MNGCGDWWLSGGMVDSMRRWWSGMVGRAESLLQGIGCRGLANARPKACSPEGEHATPSAAGAVVAAATRLAPPARGPPLGVATLASLLAPRRGARGPAGQ